MYDQKTNLRYIIPSPLKEVIGSVSSCIYNSPYCTYSSTDIATALVMTAVQNRSPYRVANSPDSDTVFERVYRGLDIETVESLVKAQHPPKGIHLEILLDGNNQGFYGKDTLGTIGIKPKNGTHKAFGYLVAFSNTAPKGVVAVRELFDGSVTDTSREVIDELSKDYPIDVIVADGEFYKAEFIQYLCDRRIRFAMRRTNTGNIRKLGVTYMEPYLYVEDVKRPDGKVIHLKYWLYRFKGIDGDFYLASNMKKKPKMIRRMFKTRRNIETSFRERNRVGIKTTTRDFLVRLFFYMVSCLVYNVWQKVRFRYSMFAIRLDDVVESIKRHIRQTLLSASDLFAVQRRHHIRLRIT